MITAILDMLSDLNNQNLSKEDRNSLLSSIIQQIKSDPRCILQKNAKGESLWLKLFTLENHGWSAWHSTDEFWNEIFLECLPEIYKELGLFLHKETVLAYALY